MNFDELLPRCKWQHHQHRYLFGWLFHQGDEVDTVIDVRGRVWSIKAGLVDEQR